MVDDLVGVVPPSNLRVVGAVAGTDSGTVLPHGADHGARRTGGVGPHPAPWPRDPRLDPELLGGGDRRNVADEFRYWRVGAIVEELDRRRFGYHVAIENWVHDLNIGTVVLQRERIRGGSGPHRGSQALEPSRCDGHGPLLPRGPPRVGRCSRRVGEGVGPGGGRVDNVEGSGSPSSRHPCRATACCCSGSEGPGLSAEARGLCDEVRSITMCGSTRSINAGVASGIAMHAWLSRHAPR
ncbi:MAG: rRNA methyltransferase [Microthrixaceae bacterium]|nr:rRNA methyltransferase [Microthrixaceae bacterium]